MIEDHNRCFRVSDDVIRADKASLFKITHIGYLNNSLLRYSIAS